MSGSLRRILRVRKLIEELSGVDLAAQAHHLRQLENKAAGWEDEARESRLQTYLAIRESDPESLALAAAGGELAAWHARQLHGYLLGAEVELERLRSQYVARRTERHQVEIVLEAQQAAFLEDQERRLQLSLDEWFSAQQTRKVRRSRES